MFLGRPLEFFTLAETSARHQLFLASAFRIKNIVLLVYCEHMSTCAHQLRNFLLCFMSLPLTGPLLKLRTLNIAFTAVTDDGLSALPRNAPKLTCIVLGKRNDNIFSTGLYTQAGIFSLLQCRPEVDLQFISA